MMDFFGVSPGSQTEYRFDPVTGECRLPTLEEIMEEERRRAEQAAADEAKLEAARKRAAPTFKTVPMPRCCATCEHISWASFSDDCERCDFLMRPLEQPWTSVCRRWKASAKPGPERRFWD
ncbi:MAG TPA: hypothetical protein VM238_18485 [Phycisphaerae bacterium]|nr:hypothetical protein [Phycisphaerae bacterium]